jgi:hypothetical protein
MVPMIDPMVPEATLLFALTTSFLGVALALIGAVGAAVAGTLRELRRHPTAVPESPAADTPCASARLAA